MLSEEDLQVIEARAKESANLTPTTRLLVSFVIDLPVLVAEVRRLNAALVQHGRAVAAQCASIAIVVGENEAPPEDTDLCDIAIRQCADRIAERILGEFGLRELPR